MAKCIPLVQEHPRYAQSYYAMEAANIENCCRLTISIIQNIICLKCRVPFEMKEILAYYKQPNTMLTGARFVTECPVSSRPSFPGWWEYRHSTAGIFIRELFHHSTGLLLLIWRNINIISFLLFYMYPNKHQSDN